MGPGLTLVVLLVLGLGTTVLLTLVADIQGERTRRQKMARIRLQMYTAENNVHRIAQQAQSEILRLLRDRREQSSSSG